jgi:hypothetical protein
MSGARWLLRSSTGGLALDLLLHASGMEVVDKRMEIKLALYRRTRNIISHPIGENRF